MKKTWGRWLVITKKIMHVQANIFLTIFYFLIIVPVGLLLTRFSPSTLHNYSGKKQHRTFWLRRLPFKQDLHFAKEQ